MGRELCKSEERYFLELSLYLSPSLDGDLNDTSHTTELTELTEREREREREREKDREKEPNPYSMTSSFHCCFHSP
jgi:hypothetical protein